jgi:superfamily II DNA or RNA helicase
MIDIAPGALVLIRDEEWLVRTADPCDVGGYALACIGMSETVRHREGIFLTAIDSVEALKPENTELVLDDSPQFISSLLYIEARLRQTIPTTPDIALGFRGAMDTLPFQLLPTKFALEQLRPRFLIADAVGLGKTLEAGILVSELMRRGRGRRILVVTTKSMMQQFQMEFWTRFSIPLTRLDSTGIQRIRRKIPASHNPFHYYDKTIISIDTLKRDTEYKHYLENAYWDIVVIDEAHNVSFKGNRTLNNKLATRLSDRSDALIMLTATPHSGDRESFASLMRMLDPTVLPKKMEYSREDVAHLFVRRFKRDVREEIRQEFPERRVFRFNATPSASEERAFECLADLKLNIDRERPAGSDMLFRTVLEKSLFSSPAACVQTVRERIKRFKGKNASHPDLPALEQLLKAVEAIQPDEFGKLAELVRRLKSDAVWKWDTSLPSDRIVVFTERIETLKFLRAHLPQRLGLASSAVAILHGQLPDTELSATVDSFGKTHSPLRLLIASDVASEGLNLHFQSHRLVHFDIPWSLMVFQQRNGRIDRYGQTATPLIAYMSTATTQERIKGDIRILEILTEKDEQAAKNIGDPSIFMGLYDEEKETRRVAEAMESHESAATFESTLRSDTDSLDWLDALMTAEATQTPQKALTRPPDSLFHSDYDYTRNGFNWLRTAGLFPNVTDFDDRHQTVQVIPDADLHEFLRDELSDEMQPDDGRFALTGNTEIVKSAIKAARDTERWPNVQYLWPLHPIIQWLDYKLLSMIGRQKAPVIRVQRGLNQGEALVMISALIPNRRGQPVLNEWFAVRMSDTGNVLGALTMDELIQLTGIGREEIPNAQTSIDVGRLGKLLPAALDFARQRMAAAQNTFSRDMRSRATGELDRLDHLRVQHKAQLELEFNENRTLRLKEQKSRDLDSLFNRYKKWISETLEVDSRAHLTVVAVVTA